MYEARHRKPLTYRTLPLIDGRHKQKRLIDYITNGVINQKNILNIALLRHANLCQLWLEVEKVQIIIMGVNIV